MAAWVAALVAIGAAWIAMHNANSARSQAGSAMKQAAEAEKARVAAEESAAEARKANEFMREKDARERAERDAAEVAEARKIRVERTGGGGLWINITNHSTSQVFDLVLNSVVPVEDPSHQWRFNSRVFGLREVAPALYPGEEKRWPVEFVSPTGEMKRMVGNRYDIVFSFTDGSGQRWRRTNDDTPERVSSTLGYAPHESQASAAPTEHDIRFQLLSLIVDRKRSDTPIDVPLLPQELGLDEALVRRCLEHLHAESLIIAMRGDDGITAISGPTPGGVRLVEGH
ncbi:hypothetical protein [Lentzea sp. NBRC 105346]|uniref:hypothetical protein n=1 Tax=Lentzea sp. NBRC 105346 TaxID=3032205 RepID=UPI002552A4E0|nr:hypothetical protein [Lentzea sp. NBRC 105346]